MWEDQPDEFYENAYAVFNRTGAEEIINFVSLH